MCVHIFNFSTYTTLKIKTPLEKKAAVKLKFSPPEKKKNKHSYISRCGGISIHFRQQQYQKKKKISHPHQFNNTTHHKKKPTKRQKNTQLNIKKNYICVYDVHEKTLRSSNENGVALKQFVARTEREPSNGTGGGT